MNRQIVGWDIGGAHLKAARLSRDGELLAVIQEACPLWKGLPQLDQALSAILAALGSGPFLHAITMTGELVDCFASRDQGVQAIIDRMCLRLPDQELLIFAGRHGLLSLEAIQAEHYLDIASVNWLASAALAARHLDTALFVDIGSTTTDILLIENHELQVQSYTDYQRLVSGELLYTGAIRTSVMAIAQQAEFNGQEMGLMAEHFATMADVYRVTGDLQEAHDQAETADGAEKTPAASARRLSRLTGFDFAQADWALWLNFARYLKSRQKHKIWLACLRQIQRHQSGTGLPVIGAGVGRFLLKEIALELGLSYRDFNEFFNWTQCNTGLDPADCAPAVAVAYLASGFG